MGYEGWKPSLIQLTLIHLVAFARSQVQNPYVCLNNGNYTNNNTYRANLNTLLSSLPSNITINGFLNASVGQNKDRVNALVLCRADQTLDQCRTCVQTASVMLPESCPNYKQAIIWFELCTLRYSNESIYGTPTSDPASFVHNSFKVLSPAEFRAARTRLLDDLRTQAANGGAELKGAAGSVNTSDSQRIYGMVQCTPDLSEQDCDNCLARAAENMKGCCDTSRGVRILMPSCNLRYEFHSFYNETRLREVRALLPPVPSPPGTKDNNTRGKKDDNTTKLVIIIVVPIGVCILLTACAAIFLIKKARQRPQGVPSTTEEITSTVESLQYDFEKIRAATRDFADANKLGRGGFGAVYKGKLLNGQDIAVKRLAKDSGLGIIEFKNEVLLLAKLQHRNLVRLLGFALEVDERVLIYEYVQNASLDQFMFDPEKRSSLDWDRRYKIIGGIAKGLLYLREDSPLRIIHRDLKASNILLDRDMNPKIADFGMKMLFGQDETQGNTSKILGTYGYMAPEHADVFSFGVLVLEIISGQRNNSIQNGENVKDLLTFAWTNWQERTAANMIDPVLCTSLFAEIMRCIHIGLLCVQQNAANRPAMASIVLMLSTSTITLPVPSEPACYMASRVGSDPSFS